jgi:predicted secreted Zn-dependent protease
MRKRLTLTNSERMGLTWRKAQLSTNNGACVEVASVPGKIAVRDSKDTGGPILVYAPEEWSAFLDGVKKGEYAI